MHITKPIDRAFIVSASGREVDLYSNIETEFGWRRRLGEQATLHPTTCTQVFPGLLHRICASAHFGSSDVPLTKEAHAGHDMMHSGPDSCKKVLLFFRIDCSPLSCDDTSCPYGAGAADDISSLLFSLIAASIGSSLPQRRPKIISNAL